MPSWGVITAPPGSYYSVSKSSSIVGINALRPFDRYAIGRISEDNLVKGV